ncbi:hypothetical protein EJ03DRAFT_166130 [Teratosphaeria nubilosa]|uniref:Uncharacterized protein n=1 Tax=Teratosphaeria nubilosa TaxID=161662 RepID=A0A6G1L208_9PEZI|nr:hypothetical protein EJ03DRAFT_166130 [Teratosphaeria nubilosa]
MWNTLKANLCTEARNDVDGFAWTTFFDWWQCHGYQGDLSMQEETFVPRKMIHATRDCDVRIHATEQPRSGRGDRTASAASRELCKHRGSTSGRKKPRTGCNSRRTDRCWSECDHGADRSHQTDAGLAKLCYNLWMIMLAPRDRAGKRIGQSGSARQLGFSSAKMAT